MFILQTVGRGGPLVKHFLAGKPPVTAPDQHKSFPANSQTVSFARYWKDAANQRFHFAPTTAGQTVELRRSALRDSAARIHNQTSGISDSRKRVRIRKNIVKKLTKPWLAGPNRLAGRLSDSDDPIGYADLREETTV